MIDRDRLAKILGRLGSAHDGELIAAGRQASRIVRNAGLTWQQVLEPVSDGVAEDAARILFAENEALRAKLANEGRVASAIAEIRQEEVWALEDEVRWLAAERKRLRQIVEHYRYLQPYRHPVPPAPPPRQLPRRRREGVSMVFFLLKWLVFWVWVDVIVMWIREAFS